jgi:hypothetical protein
MDGSDDELICSEDSDQNDYHIEMVREPEQDIG